MKGKAMKNKLVALGLLALALAGCASDPVWNYSVFPPQPEYGTAQAAPIVADTKK